MNELPDILKRPMIIAAYRADIVGKRQLLSLLFGSMVDMRERYVPLRDAVRRWTDQDLIEFAHDEARRNVYLEKEALKAAYEDSAATLLLIAAATLERFSAAMGEIVLDRGLASHVPGIHFARAISLLTNQYKHLGEWRHTPSSKRALQTMPKIAALVGDPLRTDAAAEFMQRAGISDYCDFEVAMLSCADSFATTHVIPGGHDGIVSITLKATSA